MAIAARDDPIPAAAPLARESVRAEVGHLAAMDGLRGIAVLWVVLFHYCVLRPADPWSGMLASMPFARAIVGTGYLGVDLFFLISGFLLALPWFVHAARGRPAPSAREFYARRFWRIAPAYYVQLAILFGVVLPLVLGPDYWRRDFYVYIYNAFAHAVFIHNTTPLTSGSMQVNGALWTLAVEAQFYVLLPLVMPLFVRAPKLMLAACLALAMSWHAAVADGLGPLVALEMKLGEHWRWSESVVRYLLLHQIPSYLAHFAVGIVLGRAWLRWRDSGAMPRGLWLDAAAAAGFAALAWFIVVDGNALGKQSWLLPTGGLAALLLWALARGAMADRLLGRGPLAQLGRISYSVYLLHVPLLLVWGLQAAAMPQWQVFPGYLGLLFTTSWLSWRFVEQRFLRGIARRP